MPQRRHQQPTIHCTAQQSRFHADTLDSSKEIDLRGVTVAVGKDGQHEVLSDTEVRIKEGGKYALIGRNGSGKSTLMKALSNHLIPGQSKSTKILLLSQVESEAELESESLSSSGGGESISALDFVLKGDEQLNRLHRETKELETIIQSAPSSIRTHLLQIELNSAQGSLRDANDLALRRSGTRGKAAREEVKKWENVLFKLEERLQRLAEGESGEMGLNSEPTDTEIFDKALSILTSNQIQLDSMEIDARPHQASRILSGLGFSNETMNQPYKNLSGGWRSRCSLARSLLMFSDVLLLDEPNNYLDLEATLWLEKYLSTNERTLVLTSHDQTFLNNVVDSTIYIRQSKLRYFDGTPAALQVNEKKERRKMRAMSEALDKKREHVEQSIKQGIASAKKTGDENRMRMVKSRQKKLDNRWGLEQSAKGGRFKLNRDLAGHHFTARAEIEIEEGESSVRIKLSDPPPLKTKGDLIHFENVAFRHKGAKKMLFEGVSFTLHQDGRCSFIGPNGQGKSTLVKLIVGELAPTAGSIILHPLIRIGHFSQHSVEDLTAIGNAQPELTALRYFADKLAESNQTVDEMAIRACLGSFGLQGKTASSTPLSLLSGGQKVRLAFAMVLCQSPHLLILDEISTHIDAATLQALGSALRHYKGAIVLVTHDRWLNQVVIEGRNPSAISDDLDSGTSNQGSSSEEDCRTGATYRIEAAKVKLMQNGIQQYVDSVQKRIRKRETKGIEMVR